MLHPIALSCVILASLAPAQNAAVSFSNGSVDNHIDVPYGPGLLPRTGLTIEAWITYDDATMPSNQGYRWPTIARHDVGPQGESYLLRVGAAQTNNLNIEFALRNSTGLQLTAYTFAPGRLATWTHIAATWDADTGTTTLYLDGQPVATGTATGPLHDSNQGVLRIGNGDVSNPGHEVWHGQIDELRIWPFARTAQEVLNTKDLTLTGIPGGVSFNLDNHLFDTSSFFQGVVTGTVPFVPGPPLTTVNIGATTFGASTINCSSNISTSASSPVVNGNPDFALVCYDAPANLAGTVLLATGTPLTNPLVLLGVSVYLDFNLLVPIGVSVATGPAGTTRLPMPIPADSGLVGLALNSQFLFVDPTCGVAPLGLLLSPGLSSVIQ